MEDTTVKLATFEGWKKLGRWVRAGEHSHMKSAGGDYLFTKDQTTPARKMKTTGAEKAVEQAVADLFEVGKIYATRGDRGYGGRRKVIERSAEGRLRVAGWQPGEGVWTPTGWREADGHMSSSKVENGLDLMPGAIEDPTADEKPVYADPSAQRDAEHAPASLYTPREAPMRGLPGWTMTHSDNDPVSWSSGDSGLERIAAMPNHWGK